MCHHRQNSGLCDLLRFFHRPNLARLLDKTQLLQNRERIFNQKIWIFLFQECLHAVCSADYDLSVHPIDIQVDFFNSPGCQHFFELFLKRVTVSKVGNHRCGFNLLRLHSRSGPSLFYQIRRQNKQGLPIPGRILFQHQDCVFLLHSSQIDKIAVRKIGIILVRCFTDRNAAEKEGQTSRRKLLHKRVPVSLVKLWFH